MLPTAVIELPPFRDRLLPLPQPVFKLVMLPLPPAEFGTQSIAFTTTVRRAFPDWPVDVIFTTGRRAVVFGSLRRSSVAIALQPGSVETVHLSQAIASVSLAGLVALPLPSLL